MYDAIVIGAGQAGLAAGYHLQQKGLDFTILETAEHAAGSWPHYYDSLRLFSPAHYSSLPGVAFPGDPDHYPTRDEVIDYLTHYAEAFGFRIHTRTPVRRVERINKGFRINTASGDYVTRTVVCASGSFNRPLYPNVPGVDTFRGYIFHSRQYRNPEPFRNKRVIVVGAGNSAIQIAVDLAQSARVTLATREPIRFVPQRFLGRDLHFWLKVTGADWLMASRTKSRSVGVLDTGQYRRAIEAGQPERRPMFSRFTATGVMWQDGVEEPVDTVIFATGYRSNLDFLTGIPALDADGVALQRKGVSTTVPGLYYVGLSNQHGLASATLRGVGPDASHVVQHLTGYLEGQTACRFRLPPLSCCTGVARA